MITLPGLSNDLLTAVDEATAPHDWYANSHASETRATYHQARNAYSEWRKYADAANLQWREVRRLLEVALEQYKFAYTCAQNAANEARAVYLRHGGDPAQVDQFVTEATSEANAACVRAGVYLNRISDMVNHAAQVEVSAADLAPVITNILMRDIGTLIFRREDDGRITAEFGTAPTDDYAIYASGKNVVEALNYLLQYMKERVAE